MGRILLAFGTFQAASVAAFLWILPRELGRRPEELTAWAAATSGWFWVLVWPLLDERRAGERRRSVSEHALEVAGDAAVLFLALAPWLVAGCVLGGVARGELFRTMGPALAMLGAGAAVAWSARIGGPAVRRAGVAAAFAGVALGPVVRFLSGAAGSFPGDAPTLTARPWLALAALAFPVAALAARRLRSGEVAPGGPP